MHHQVVADEVELIAVQACFSGSYPVPRQARN
jgi:hypothetical protein